MPAAHGRAQVALVLLLAIAREMVNEVAIVAAVTTASTAAGRVVSTVTFTAASATAITGHRTGKRLRRAESSRRRAVVCVSVGSDMAVCIPTVQIYAALAGYFLEEMRSGERESQPSLFKVFRSAVSIV